MGRGLGDRDGPRRRPSRPLGRPRERPGAPRRGAVGPREARGGVLRPDVLGHGHPPGRPRGRRGPHVSVVPEERRGGPRLCYDERDAPRRGEASGDDHRVLSHHGHGRSRGSAGHRDCARDGVPPRRLWGFPRQRERPRSEPRRVCIHGAHRGGHECGFSSVRRRRLEAPIGPGQRRPLLPPQGLHGGGRRLPLGAGPRLCALHRL
mmetsp:Transcript_10454/g.24746  ORF Transcript_10454/g.24746 Transcript_10454/m.24746 type:complete len:206 (+) Transcript_10454:836-1453(+)